MKTHTEKTIKPSLIAFLRLYIITRLTSLQIHFYSLLQFLTPDTSPSPFYHFRSHLVHQHDSKQQKRLMSGCLSLLLPPSHTFPLLQSSSSIGYSPFRNIWPAMDHPILPLYP